VIYLRIDSVPVRYFYRDPRTLAALPAGAARHALLDQPGDLRSDVAGENGNVTVTLRNAANETSALYAVPPIGAAAVLVDTVAGERFAGVVAGMTLGDVATVELEA
jgi:hypothetical protein